MQIPLEIKFRRMEPSEAVEANIREKVAKLERHYDRIVSCRVVVEAPHRRQSKGKLFAVTVNVAVPGKELVVNHTGSKDRAHEDAYVAIRDAFAAAGRQLEDHARKVRGEVKTHAPPEVGIAATVGEDTVSD